LTSYQLNKMYPMSKTDQTFLVIKTKKIWVEVAYSMTSEYSAKVVLTGQYLYCIVQIIGLTV